MEKKGVISDYLVWIILGIGIIIFVMIVYMILFRSSEGIIGKIVNFFRFGG
jgi:hypothetical protein